MESTDDNNKNLIAYDKKDDLLEPDKDSYSENLTINDDGKVVVIKYDKQSGVDIRAYTASVLIKANEQLESEPKVEDKLSSKHVPSAIRDIFSKTKRVRKVGEIQKNGAYNQETSKNHQVKETSDKQKSISIYNRCKNWANKVARKVSAYYYVLVNNLRQSEAERNKDQRSSSKRPIKGKDDDDSDEKTVRNKKKDSKAGIEEKKRIDYLNAALRIEDF